MQRQWRLFVPALTFVLFEAFAMAPTSPVKADDEQTESIVGTWIGPLSLNNSSLVITELPSFGPGGTVAGTNTFSHNCQNPSLPPVLTVELSDYFGSWAPIAGSNQFAITAKRLVFACPNTPAASYGPSFPGQNVGIVSIQAVGTVKNTENGDTLTGPVTFQLTNLSDQVVFAGSGTASFTRVAIEPLNGIGSDPSTKQCLPPGAHCSRNSDCCTSPCGISLHRFGNGGLVCG